MKKYAHRLLIIKSMNCFHTRKRNQKNNNMVIGERIIDVCYNDIYNNINAECDVLSGLTICSTVRAAIGKN